MAFSYQTYPEKNEKLRQSLLQSPSRFQAISEREDRSDTPVEAVKSHAPGKYFLRHRGCMLMKSPEDQAVLRELMVSLRPATIFEIGTFTGGSSLWMADTLKLEGISSNIFCMDIDIGMVEKRVKELKPDNITFLQGDSNKIGETFGSEQLKTLPHPWLVIEDAHVNVVGVMENFAPYMVEGDYFIVEDTSPILPKYLVAEKEDEPFPEYEPIGTRLLKCVKTFLERNKGSFAVDSYFTDFFGYNGTWNWHGYIRRM